MSSESVRALFLLFPPRREGANTHSRLSRLHRLHGGEEGASMSPCEDLSQHAYV